MKEIKVYFSPLCSDNVGAWVFHLISYSCCIKLVMPYWTIWIHNITLHSTFAALCWDKKLADSWYYLHLVFSCIHILFAFNFLSCSKFSFNNISTFFKKSSWELFGIVYCIEYLLAKSSPGESKSRYNPKLWALAGTGQCGVSCGILIGMLYCALLSGHRGSLAVVTARVPSVSYFSWRPPPAQMPDPGPPQGESCVGLGPHVTHVSQSEDRSLSSGPMIAQQTR